MVFRVVTGCAAALLLTASGLMADPMERSKRPQNNPRFTAATGTAAPVGGQFAAAMIGPALPAVTATPEGSLLRAPVNPRLGFVTLSTSNRSEAAVALPLPDLATYGLPVVGDMLPASMLVPGDVAAAATPAEPANPPAASLAAAPALIGPVMPELPVLPAVVAPQDPGTRPKARPAALASKIAAMKAQEAERAEQTAAAEAAAKAAIVQTSLRPKERPAKIIRLASAPVPTPKSIPAPEEPASKGKKKAPVSAKGSVCGVAAIKGENIAPIPAKVQGCGLTDGVRVTSVSGVRLSMAATIDCQTAKALNTWVERVAQPAYGNQIVELQIAGHYVCRTRNNKKGAKVSEHGRGKAVDISGFRLASGKVLKVLGGFDKTMRQAHKGACGIFGTTLGPGSDGYHEDHLHFDTASHRSGTYCR